jgi:beta-lactam-binding protein with PASTA domain
VSAGTIVALDMSAGVCQTVPDVTGQTQADASTAIEDANMTVGEVTRQCSDTVAAGLVISQNPAGDEQAPLGSAVSLVLSSGSCLFLVPDVAGQTRDEAEMAIMGVGLNLGVVTEGCSDTVAEGLVMSQDPPAGTSVPPGDTVALVLSAGSCSVSVPDVAGMPQADAAEAFAEASLTVGAITQVCSSTVAAGLVISQDPSAGATADFGSAVALVVSTGGCGGAANDTCGTAAILLLDAPYSNSTAGAATDLVTADGSGADVWFTFEAATTAKYRFSLCGSSFDTTLYVYEGDCNSPVQVGYNNDASCGAQSQVDLSLSGGTVYFLRVAGHAGETGDYTLRASIPPPVDYCPGNVLADGGFESGAANGAWQMQSLNRESPLCTNFPEFAQEGHVFVLFGASQAAEDGSVTQEVTLPAGSAKISFYVWMPVAGSTGYMRLLVDGQKLFEATEADASLFSNWARIEVDISAFADGGQHAVAFVSHTDAMDALLDFALDSVCVQAFGVAPDVVGQTLTEANTAIHTANLTTGAVTQQCSDTVAAGLVISQDPAAGTSAAPGSAVALVISTGSCPVTLPNVVGETQIAAGTLLTDAHLSAGTVTQQCSGTVEAGLIISQDPAAGTSAAPGSAVALVVSTGPCPVTVPNLADETQEAAGILLTGANLTTGVVTQECSNTVAAGSVISQNPAAATQTAPGSAVALVVSTGPCPVTVPYVAGETREAAGILLTGAQLTTGIVTQQCSNSVTAGLVISQDPAAATQAAPGSAVALVISTGSCPVTVPDLMGLVRLAALSLLTGANLTAGTMMQECSSTVTAGLIMRQDPAAGTQAVPGSAVSFVVSTGPCVTVPNVVGQGQTTAGGMLSAAGLATGTLTQQCSDTVDKGLVLSQTPPANAQVSSGSAVALVISTGPCPVTVPNVVGQTEAAAGNVLSAVFLTIGTITRQNSATVPEGAIISQDPAAGTQAVPGGSVSLVVSLGPGDVMVPDVTGMTQEAAGTALQGAHLTAGTVTQQCSDTVAEGKIISQNPVPTTQASRGSSVALVVSTGPCPVSYVSVPDLAGLAVTEAQTALNDAHLIPGDVTQHCSNTVAQGAVISQNPPAGTMVTSGGPVNLVLSAGACPPVPPTVEDLRGRLTSSFALMDTNGDGKISFEEALALLPGLTQAVFDEVNTSGTGQITRTEAGLDTTGCAGCSGGKSAFTHGQMLELLGNLFVGGLGLMVLSVFAKRRL